MCLKELGFSFNASGDQLVRASLRQGHGRDRMTGGEGVNQLVFALLRLL